MSFVSSSFRRATVAAAIVLTVVAAPVLEAGFAGTDVFIPAVARASGLFGAEFYSTLWITNLSGSPVSLQIQLYARDASNTSPASFSDTLAPGETKRYDNVVETLFHRTGAGAIRVVANGDVFASSRTYSLPASGKLEDSVGLFFTSVPSGFAIGNGETATLQGVSQGGVEAFRYNFGFVETQGQAATVHVVLKDPSGALLGSKDVSLPASGQTQLSVGDLTPVARRQPSAIATTNGRLEASVSSGDGRVILFGTQIANGSNDSAGFEMSFKKSLLAAPSTPYVRTLNGLSDDVTLQAGANVTVTKNGNTLTIASTGGGGGGSGVPSVNGITGAVTIAGAGATSVQTNGSTVTVTSPTTLPPSGPASGGLNGTYPGPGIAPNAVASAQIVDGSIAANDIAAGAILTEKIADGAVTNLKIADGAVGTAQLANGAVTLAKISTAGAQVPTVLTYTGGGTPVWASANGVVLPYDKSASASEFLFSVTNNGTGGGLRGLASSGIGVFGLSSSGPGMRGESGTNNGVVALSNTGDALYAQTGNGPGHAIAAHVGGTGDGLNLTFGSGHGVWVKSNVSGTGVHGEASGGRGVEGYANPSGTGVYGEGYYGVFGKWNGGVSGLAGRFDGPVTVSGTLTKPAGSFKIDHPLDPENKYLYHSFVESPDMKNVYDGVAVLDAVGEAIVSLPEWFEALNKDFRYQLTAIGAAAPNLHVAAEIAHNRFKIGGGKAFMKVSWQVTGTRQDAWANAHRIPVEEEKSPKARGYYLHPELYGEPEEKEVTWAENPELMRGLQAASRETEPR